MLSPSPMWQLPDLERFLLDPRLDINTRGGLGEGPLHAAMTGSQVRALLRHPRLDWAIRDRAGRTALAFQASL